MALADDSLPLVSCIMPTCDRRRFVAQAIGYFRRQDYTPKELIVIDDGTDPVGDLMPRDERIRYVRLEQRATVGAKRNLACEQARGEIIVHWDDDDWMADWRLRYQVGGLRQSQADLCGLSRLLFFDPIGAAAWDYVFPGTTRPWVYGATLCYSTAFWQRHPFADINVGEDTRFVWSDPTAKVAALPQHRFMVSLIHAGNTSPKRPDARCWLPFALPEIRKLIGGDWEFYAGEGGPTMAAGPG